MLLENIKKLCASRNISLSALEKTLGFGNSTIAKWADCSPTVEKLSLVADYFNVSVEYLLYGDPSAGIKKERPADGEAPDQDKLLEIVRDSQDMSFLLKVMDEVNKSIQKLQ